MQIPPPPPVPSRLQSLQLNLTRYKEWKDPRNQEIVFSRQSSESSSSDRESINAEGLCQQEEFYLRLPCWQMAPPWHSLHLKLKGKLMISTNLYSHGDSIAKANTSLNEIEFSHRLYSRGPETVVLAACLALAIFALAPNAIVVADSFATTISTIDFLAPMLAFAILFLHSSKKNTHQSRLLPLGAAARRQQTFRKYGQHRTDRRASRRAHISLADPNTLGLVWVTRSLH